MQMHPKKADGRQMGVKRESDGSQTDVRYSPVPNKRVGANKHVFWKIASNEINV